MFGTMCLSHSNLQDSNQNPTINLNMTKAMQMHRLCCLIEDFKVRTHDDYSVFALNMYCSYAGIDRVIPVYCCFAYVVCMIILILYMVHRIRYDSCVAVVGYGDCDAPYNRYKRFSTMNFIVMCVALY